MPAKFVIKKGRTGQFRFSLVGRNGQSVATSETYTIKASCMNGVEAVKALAADADIEYQTTKAWTDEQAKLRAATKTAAKAAKKAIGEAASAKKAVKTAKSTAQRSAGVVRPRGTAT